MRLHSPRLATCTLLLVFLASAGLAQYKDLYQAGQTKQRDGKNAEARKDFEEALKLATTNTEKADAQIGVALTFDAERNYPGARAEYAKVLAIEGVTPEQKAQAQYAIGMDYYWEQNYAGARTELGKVLALAEVPAKWRVQAQMFSGHCWNRECENKLGEARKAYADAIIAYAKVPDIPGVLPGQKGDAQMAVVNTLLTMKSYADARAELVKTMEISDLPGGTKALAQVTLGKSYFFEKNYVAARGELAKAVTMDGISDTTKADAQLHIGLSYYEVQDYERAKPEFEKVLAMRGAGDRQTHEATLRLRLRKLIPGDEKVLAVLFIGASHTQGWNIPQIVEVLAASAPAGSPRIIAGEYLRGGTSIGKFWEEGAGPDTARGKIVAEPWDFVVFECYPFLFGYDECGKYARKLVDLTRGRNATPILFDAPAFFRIPYPAECQKNHDENVTLGKDLHAPVAAAGYAWIKYLGPTPTPEQRLALYHPDAVHTSRKGAYMLACSVYSAITGLSPVGLTHTIPSFAPDGISPEDAAALQEASWQAFKESNPDLKPLL